MFGIKFLKESEYRQLREEMTMAQRELENLGWINLNTDAGSSSDVVVGRFKDMIKRCRLFYFNNPLAGQWVHLTTQFVFGEGISKPKASEESIQEVVDAFWDDKDNIKALTGYSAQQLLCNKLQYEGNLFFVLFDDDIGNTKVRILNTEEVDDIIRDSEDRMRPNFYKVSVVDRRFNFSSGSYDISNKGHIYYPDVDIFDLGEFKIPQNKLKSDARIFHVKINCDINDKFGIPELYRGADWIKAHKTMAEDMATLVKALSQFAWKKKVKGNAAAVQSIAGAMASKMNLSNIRNSAGQTQVENDGVDMQPIDIKTGGVQIGSDGLRQMKLMVCAASGIFEHYYGDPSTGNLATAKSMELPMLKKFVNLQSLWRGVYLGILNYVVDKKIEAGVLPGKVEPDHKNRRNIVTTDLDRKIDLDFPPILEEDLKIWADALKVAKESGLVSDETAARLFLMAANVNNLDEEISKLEEEQAEKEAKALEIAQQTPPVYPNQPQPKPGVTPVKEPKPDPVKEAISTPDKKIALRHAKKNNYTIQRMNGYRKVVAGHFKTLLDDVKESTKAYQNGDKWVVNVPELYEKLNRFTVSMQESAKQYFPIAVQIGEAYMQSVLKDIKPNLKINETIYEAQGKAKSILQKRLQWNETYLNESLEFAMLESCEKALREQYVTEGAARASISSSITKFESRVEHYVGAFWTVQEEAVKEAGRGTGVMVNFVGPDDDHDCEGCRESVNGNPWPIDDAPLPGEQECLGRCRHALQVIS